MSESHQLVAELAMEQRLLVDEQLLFRLAVDKEFLLDAGTVQIGKELVASLLELLQLLVGHSPRHMRHDVTIQVGQADLARVDDIGKVLFEVLVPNSLIYPRDLQEM